MLQLAIFAKFGIKQLEPVLTVMEDTHLLTVNVVSENLFDYFAYFI